MLSGHFTSATVDLQVRLKEVCHEMMVEVDKWKKEDARMEEQFLIKLEERRELIVRTGKHFAASLRLGSSENSQF